MSEEFKVIETQEDFDKAIQKRLAQKDRELEEKYKDYLSPEKVADLKKVHEGEIDKLTGDLKKANETIAGHDQIVSDLTKRVTIAEGSLLRSKIAHEKGVPFELADRLVGSNEEELSADADKLASFLAPKNTPPLRSDEQAPGASADLANMLTQLNSQFTN